MSDDLTALDITVITITQDQEGLVSLDSDVDAGETLLILERVKAHAHRTRDVRGGR